MPLTTNRHWPADLALRLLGLAALAAAGVLAAPIHHRVVLHAVDGPGPGDFLVTFAAVLLLFAGLALAGNGHGLLRRVPRPPRALL